MDHKVSTITRRLFLAVVLVLSFNLQSIELVSKNAAIFEHALKQKRLMAGVELLLVNNDVERVIAPTYQLKNGDRIRFRIRTSVNSQYNLYVLDKQGNKVKSLLAKGQVKATATTLVPSPQRGIFELDGKPGIEWVQLVISSNNGEKPTIRRNYPHGKIEQIILRNIELLSLPTQKVQYDPLSQIIYFSLQKPSKENNLISLKLGLSHSSTPIN
jgi:hypothetical protein